MLRSRIHVVSTGITTIDRQLIGLLSLCMSIGIEEIYAFVRSNLNGRLDNPQSAEWGHHYCADRLKQRSWGEVTNLL